MGAGGAIFGLGDVPCRVIGGRGGVMMSGLKMTTVDADDRETNELEREGAAAYASYDAPLPGLFDFIGAHVGGELAEEILR
jgi:hypothetical protein